MTSSAGAQTARLVRLDVATGAATVLAEDPAADVSSVHIDPDTREPQIVTVLKDRSEYIVLDDSVAGDLAAIRAIHPGDPSLRAPTTPTRSGWSASPTTPGRSPTTPGTGPPRRPGSCSSTSRRCPGTSWPPWSRSRSRAATA